MQYFTIKFNFNVAGSSRDLIVASCLSPRLSVDVRSLVARDLRVSADPDHSNPEKFFGFSEKPCCGARKRERDPGFPPFEEVAEAAA